MSRDGEMREFPEERMAKDDANLKFLERMRAKQAGLSATHRDKFRCDGCGDSLLFGPADGIGDKIYHQGWCADDARAAYNKTGNTE